MTAISKTWSTIADTQIDPDSPITQALLTSIRDDLVHLREWLGASFTGGAVQDHNHDGVNSALLEVGANHVRNASFEDGAAGWTLSNFSGGSNAISTTNFTHGAKALELTSTVLANGGGEAINSEYIPVASTEAYVVKFWVWASVANVSGGVDVVWYNNAKATISSTAVLSATNLPLAATMYRFALTAPTSARWARVKLKGGIPASGTAVGTVRFDGVAFYADYPNDLIAQVDVTSATAVVELPVTGTYPRYTVEFNEVYGTVNADLHMGVKYNGGTIETVANFYHGAPNANITVADTKVLVASTLGTGGGATASGTVVWVEPNQTSNYKKGWAVASSYISGTFRGTNINFTWNRATVPSNVEVIRFLMSSGNVGGGTFRLYGSGR